MVAALQQRSCPHRSFDDRRPRAVIDWIERGRRSSQRFSSERVLAARAQRRAQRSCRRAKDHNIVLRRPKRRRPRRASRQRPVRVEWRPSRARASWSSRQRSVI